MGANVNQAPNAKQYAMQTQGRWTRATTQDGLTGWVAMCVMHNNPWDVGWVI